MGELIFSRQFVSFASEFLENIDTIYIHIDLCIEQIQQHYMMLPVSRRLVRFISNRFVFLSCRLN